MQLLYEKHTHTFPIQTPSLELLQMNEEPSDWLQNSAVHST